MEYYCKNSILCHIYELYGIEPFIFGALGAAAAMLGVGIYLVITDEPSEESINLWLAVAFAVATGFFLGTVFGVVLTQFVAISSYAPISDANKDVVIPPRPPIPPCNLQFDGCIYTPANELRDLLPQLCRGDAV